MSEEKKINKKKMNATHSVENRLPDWCIHISICCTYISVHIHTNASVYIERYGEYMDIQSEKLFGSMNRTLTWTLSRWGWCVMRWLAELMKPDGSSLQSFILFYIHILYINICVYIYIKISLFAISFILIAFSGDNHIDRHQLVCFRSTHNLFIYSFFLFISYLMHLYNFPYYYI